MITPEQPVLTDLHIGSLLEVIPFSAQQRKGVEGNIRTRVGMQAVIQGVTDEFACSFEQLVKPLVGAEVEVVSKRQALEHNSLGSVLGRIRRNIFAHPDFRPPLPLEPLKLLGNREPDQKALGLLEAQERLGQMKARIDSEVEILEGGKFAEIDRQYRRLENADNNILAVSRNVAVSSDDRVLEAFAEIIPWQMPQAVSEYAIYWASSERILGNFEEFVRFMYDRFKYGREVPEYKVTTEGYKKLNSRTQSCWVAFVEYRKLQEFFQIGLLKTEPQVPEIILRIGSDLDL